MKPRVLSAILAQMPPAEAKKLTEALEARVTALGALTGQGANG
jgi:flagellar motility protein MotE (MotC chaperone)